MLLHESYCPRDPGQYDRYRALVEELARRVPLWRMDCNREPEAAQVAHNAMSQ